MTRKLRPYEETALVELLRTGKCELPVWLKSAEQDALHKMMVELRKAGRVIRNDHEDGVTFSLSLEGEREAEAIARERAV